MSVNPCTSQWSMTSDWRWKKSLNLQLRKLLYSSGRLPLMVLWKPKRARLARLPCDDLVFCSSLARIHQYGWEKGRDWEISEGKMCFVTGQDNHHKTLWCTFKGFLVRQMKKTRNCDIMILLCWVSYFHMIPWAIPLWITMAKPNCQCGCILGNKSLNFIATKYVKPL